MRWLNCEQLAGANIGLGDFFGKLEFSDLKSGKEDKKSVFGTLYILNEESTGGRPMEEFIVIVLRPAPILN